MAATKQKPVAPNTKDMKLSKGAAIAIHHADIAFDFDESVVLTPVEDKQCLRRVDMVLMPLMFISFGLQYMDKACLTGAALFGIIEDLELFQVRTIDGEATLDLQKYTYATLIFFWGYLLGSKFSCFLSLAECKCCSTLRLTRLDYQLSPESTYASVFPLANTSELQYSSGAPSQSARPPSDHTPAFLFCGT